jgi:Tfp pilus assembly protein PilN
MRPVNLLPPEERRGGRAPTRTGAMPYVVVGALVLLLVGVSALVLTSNQVSEREDEVTTLQREDAEEHARAERLAAYTQFRTLQEQRVATVTSLADSRFDWERVMHELSLVLPHDVWLVEMTATASPDTVTTGGGGGASELRASSPGPALELSGCASGQDAVAGFVTALKDIDGVTRVGVKLSELPGAESDAGASSGESSGGETDCQTRKFIAKFEIIAVFDAAPIPLSETSETVAPAATEVASTTSEESSEESTEGAGE